MTMTMSTMEQRERWIKAVVLQGGAPQVLFCRLQQSQQHPRGHAPPLSPEQPGYAHCCCPPAPRVSRGLIETRDRCWQRGSDAWREG